MIATSSPVPGWTWSWPAVGLQTTTFRRIAVGQAVDSDCLRSYSVVSGSSASSQKRPIMEAETWLWVQNFAAPRRRFVFSRLQTGSDPSAILQRRSPNSSQR